jgi:NTE family protein
MEPDWVIGTSIGAINAAIIVGNPPEQRLSHLTEFWRRMDQAGALRAPWTQHLSEEARLQINSASMISFGLPNFFSARPFSPFGLGVNVKPNQASIYDTAPLCSTLEELVDFDYLHHSPVRLSVGAVDVESGEMRYFDNRSERLTVSHIMASGALPPSFPAVEIDGRFYWDGGIHSNTPLERMLQEYPRVHSLCFLANVWQERDVPPTNMAAVARRSKELQFASRTNMLVAMELELHKLRHALTVLEAHLPQAAFEKPEVLAAIEEGCLSVFHLIRLQAPRLAKEDQYKDIDFAKDRVQQRWGAGYRSTVHAIAAQAWHAEIGALDGVIVHDYSDEDLSAEERARIMAHQPKMRDGAVCSYRTRRPAAS